MYNPETAYKAFIETRKEAGAMFEVKQERLNEGISVFKVIENGKTKEAFVSASISDEEVQKWQAKLNGETVEKPKRKKK